MAKHSADNATASPIEAEVSPESLRKLWLALSLVTLLFALSCHGAIQGADLNLKLKVFAELLFEKGTPDSIIAMWGVLLVSILIILTNPLMKRHAQVTSASSWENYPFRLLDISPLSQIGRVAGRLGFVVLSIVPLVALVHFWRVFANEGRLCAEVADNPYVLVTPDGSVFALPQDWTFSRLLFDGYRLGSSEYTANPCEHATTFFPVLEPLLMAGFTLWALVTFTLALIVIESSSKKVES